jgi:ABC-type glycerol-3-phosphate transport system permease component
MALSMTASRRMMKGVGNVLLALMVLWTATPFYWMIVTSLKLERYKGGARRPILFLLRVQP